jgi:hypothetical protein
MTTDNFRPHKFHDNLVHGISMSVEGYNSELRLDLDYIADWPACVPGDSQRPEFTITRGLVTFQDVTDLCVKIDWGDSGYTTAVSGPYIDVIQKEKIVPALRLPDYFRWRIIFTDERSSITFGASSMSFVTQGSLVTIDRQYLTDQERSG